MFGKSKDIKDKVNGKEEEVVVEIPKRRGRKPKEVIEEEAPVEAPQTNENINEESDDDILHNIDRDIGAAHYMLAKRSIQEVIDAEGVRIWSDILILVDIALQNEDVQTKYVEEYKVIEEQRIAYQKAMMEAQQKQQAQQTQKQN